MTEHLWRCHPDAVHGPHRECRTTLHTVPLNCSLLADPGGADHRPQPSLGGFGVITEISTGFPGYDFVIRPERRTVGTILRENGYATSWFGKNHNTPASCKFGGAV